VSYLTDIEAGFLHTVLRLFSQPGQVVLDYWRGKTVCYYEPFRYLVLWTAFTVLLNFALGVDDLMQARFQPPNLEQQLGAERIAVADQQFDSWLNLLTLLLLPVNSLATYVLFRRHRKTFGEHLILHCFVMGQLALIGGVSQLVLILDPNLLDTFLIGSVALGILYNTYALRGIFAEGWPITLAKAALVNVVSLASYAALVGGASLLALRLGGG
jgi:hypothetical protein